MAPITTATATQPGAGDQRLGASPASEAKDRVLGPAACHRATVCAVPQGVLRYVVGGVLQPFNLALTSSGSSNEAGSAALI